MKFYFLPFSDLFYAQIAPSLINLTDTRGCSFSPICVKTPQFIEILLPNSQNLLAKKVGYLHFCEIFWALQYVTIIVVLNSSQIFLKARQVGPCFSI
jgi:hypothetical protein